MHIEPSSSMVQRADVCDRVLRAQTLNHLSSDPHKELNILQDDRKQSFTLKRKSLAFNNSNRDFLNGPVTFCNSRILDFL